MGIYQWIPLMLKYLKQNEAKPPEKSLLDEPNDIKQVDETRYSASEKVNTLTDRLRLKVNI